MVQYCTVEDVVNETGYSASDLSTFGCEMNQLQFENYIKQLIETSSSFVNRYCNVNTFEIHEVTDEYHTLQVPDINMTVGAYPYYGGYPIDFLTYPSQQRMLRIYPRDYPVKTVTSVQINRARDNKMEDWFELQEVSTTQNGDWKLIDEGFDMKHILLTKYFPYVGTNNVKITYTAGFEPENDIWSIIKRGTILLVINFINYKKKNQEVVTVRAAGIRDYSTMFSTFTANQILTPEIQYILNMIRQRSVDPNMYV